MKNTLVIVICFVFAVVLFGCVQNNHNTHYNTPRGIYYYLDNDSIYRELIFTDNNLISTVNESGVFLVGYYIFNYPHLIDSLNQDTIGFINPMNSIIYLNVNSDTILLKPIDSLLYLTKTYLIDDLRLNRLFRQRILNMHQDYDSCVEEFIFNE